MHARTGDAPWQSHYRKTRIAFRNGFFRIPTHTFAARARDANFCENLTRLLKVIRPKELGVGVSIDPNDDTSSVTAISRTCSKANFDAVLTIFP